MFTTFTAPNGDAMRIVTAMIVAVLHPSGGVSGSRAQIVTLSGSYFVKETPEEAEKLADRAKG